MGAWDNSTGRPLAGEAWLDAHHRAKFPERRAFAERLAGLAPRRLVDLGCASGHWLALLNDVLPANCEFIGIDSDPAAIDCVAKLARDWERSVWFEVCDLHEDQDALPEGDLALAFNVFNYLPDLPGFLDVGAGRWSSLAVRQYDGASIRFGPMHTDVRQRIDRSLRASLSASSQFDHYDLDRVFSSLVSSRYRSRSIEFELFERSSPFPPSFEDYYKGMVEWTRDLVSDVSSDDITRWLDEQTPGRYFFEVDLVAILS